MCIVEEYFLNYLQRGEFFVEVFHRWQLLLCSPTLTFPTVFPVSMAILHLVWTQYILVLVLVRLCGIFGSSFCSVWVGSVSGFSLFWVVFPSLSTVGVVSGSAAFE